MTGHISHGAGRYRRQRVLPYPVAKQHNCEFRAALKRVVIQTMRRRACGMDTLCPAPRCRIGAARACQQGVVVDADLALPGIGQIDQTQRRGGLDDTVGIGPEVSGINDLECRQAGLGINRWNIGTAQDDFASRTGKCLRRIDGWDNRAFGVPDRREARIARSGRVELFGLTNSRVDASSLPALRST